MVEAPRYDYDLLAQVGMHFPNTWTVIGLEKQAGSLFFVINNKLIWYNKVINMESDTDGYKD